MTSPAETAAYDRAVRRAHAAHQWAVRAAMRTLTDAHVITGGHRTARLEQAWQVYRQQVDDADAAYIRAVTRAYNTALTVGGAS